MLRSEALALSVPVRDMVRLERRSGRRSAFWTGAGWGASIGGISGLGAGLILIKPAACTDPVRHLCGKAGAGRVGGLGGIGGRTARRDPGGGPRAGSLATRVSRSDAAP